jgi:periplasmic protein CpxP/Spy
MKAIAAKISLFIIICLFFGINSGFSQDVATKKTPEEKAAKITERMTEKLKLDDTQRQKVHDLYLSHFTDMKAIRESAKETDKSALKEKIKSDRKELKAGLKNILTDEQFKLLKHKMHRMHCKHQKRNK